MLFCLAYAGPRSFVAVEIPRKQGTLVIHSQFISYCLGIYNPGNRHWEGSRARGQWVPRKRSGQAHVCCRGIWNTRQDYQESEATCTWSVAQNASSFHSCLCSVSSFYWTFFEFEFFRLEEGVAPDYKGAKPLPTGWEHMDNYMNYLRGREMKLLT